MKSKVLQAGLLLVGCLMTGPAQAQFTVLDQAQDAAEPPPLPIERPGPPPAAPPPPVCGLQPISVASMTWPSAQLLAEIHVRLLAQEYGCDARVTPGDMGATTSSMTSSGQPAVAPELWVGRAADVWNAGIEAQRVRVAAPTYVETSLEGWFIPGYLTAANPALKTAAGLAAALPAVASGAKVRLISCPIDWACSLINRHLVEAFGLSSLVDVVEPANRFEMDALIAEAVSRKEPVIFYYWQPNAVLSQFDFVAIDMGAYDEDAAKCLARLTCADPKPSAYASESVVVAVAEWVFTDTPAIASYFQRTGMPVAVMNDLLAALNEPGASVGSVADSFVANRRDVWENWAVKP